MFVLQNKEMLIASYTTIITNNLKPKEVVYTELLMFVMFGALTQADMDTLMGLYPVEVPVEEPTA